MCGEHVRVQTRIQALAHCVQPWEASPDQLRSRSVPPCHWLVLLGSHKGKGVKVAIQYLFADRYATRSQYDIFSYGYPQLLNSQICFLNKQLAKQRLRSMKYLESVSISEFEKKSCWFEIFH